jgi:exopolysaccharide production protein ExoZ
MLGLCLFALGVQLPSRARVSWMAGLVLLGDASYALYLSHPFSLDVVELVVGHSMPRRLAEQSWFAPSYLLLGFLGAIVAALVFYRLIERPVTGWLNAKVRSSRSGAAVAAAAAGGAAPGR